MHHGFTSDLKTLFCGSRCRSDVQSAKNKGRLKQPDRTPKFVAFGGDGATYDIGFQWISGCFERGHNMMYVCLDNEVYANTGGQRSSFYPDRCIRDYVSSRTYVSYGEKMNKKDMMSIMAAHGAPYVAQVAPNKWKDMVAKIQKGFAAEGPVYINAMSACTTEWKFAPEDTISVSDLAVDSLVFPLYEIIDGPSLTSRIVRKI
jgi:pyruvate ferredoxin oxidoreductase beta subunit